MNERLRSAADRLRRRLSRIDRWPPIGTGIAAFSVVAVPGTLLALASITWVMEFLYGKAMALAVASLAWASAGAAWYFARDASAVAVEPEPKSIQSASGEEA